MPSIGSALIWDTIDPVAVKCEIGGISISSNLLNTGNVVFDFTTEQLNGLAAGDYSIMISAAATDNSNESIPVQVEVPRITDEQKPQEPKKHDPLNPPSKDVPIDMTMDFAQTINGDIKNLTKILLNGKEMGQLNKIATCMDLTIKGYRGTAGKVGAGSVIVTLNKNIINWLPGGVQTLTFVFNDNGVTSEGEVEFTIQAKANVPKTGDENDMVGWLVVLLSSTLGCACVLVWRKRRQSKGTW